MSGGETTISRPSCILSVIVLVLVISSTGLLVLVLKGEYAHPHHENGSAHHHHHGPHHHDDFQLSDQGHHPGDRYLHEPWRYFKLPDTVVPMHYDLTMEPDLEGASFNGKVSIDVNVTARTR
ncbi:hypothetical protein JTE90_005354 [Oedothorax gibbosus]|uniref:Uncharacterized protein n=1 Tax=Oedothorax gibbosus TaxID=931172 RepID=A0AAV6UM81_9ARAC|nr:hypothetical protein JTE90_005354 [Oedothorax gibbosus]